MPIVAQILRNGCRIAALKLSVLNAIIIAALEVSLLAMIPWTAQAPHRMASHPSLAGYPGLSLLFNQMFRQP